MNGERTPDAPRIINAPKINSAIIIGIIHHSLRAHRKRINSPRMPNRDTKLLTDSLKVIFGWGVTLVSIFVVYFLTRNGPIASRSSPLLLNVCQALAGVDTIGSPRRLNEVFSKTGT